MQSSPRNWVLKALSPKLDPSDLRAMLASPHSPAPDLDPSGVTDDIPACIPSGDVVAQAWQVTLSEDTGSSNTSSTSVPCSPTSSSCSHCGFYSFVEDPTSPEAELNEAWMVSPERRAQLATLREDQDFRVQAYTRGQTPGTLFEHSNGDFPYQMHPSEAHVVQEEERWLRQEIIRSQAPKKSPTPKTQWQSLDRVDSPDKIQDGFSLFFQQSSARTDPNSPVKPGAVDSGQINFSAARQQFLNMEQERLKAMLSPVGSPRTQSRSFQRDLSLSTQVDSSVDRSSSGVPDRVYSHLVCETTDQANTGPSDSLHQNCSSSRSEPLASHETPIEREIRVAQEREESLRRLRGLKLSDDRDQMIQIRTKALPLLFSTPRTPSRPKDKARVSFLIQQDRPLLNHSSAKDPADRSIQAPNKVNPSSEQDCRIEDEGLIQACCPHRHHEEAEAYISSRSSANISSKAMDNWTEGVTGPLSSPSWRGTLANRRPRGAPDSIQKEIDEDLRREQELQELRTSRGLSVCPDKQLDSLEQTGSLASHWTCEHKADKSPACHAVRLPSLSNITPQPWGSIRQSPSQLLPQPSTARGQITLPDASSPPQLTASSHPQPSALPLQKGLTKTLLEDFEERRLLLKLQENSYAGIQPTDDVNTEVLQATRVTRQKNKRALFWEAGVYANQYNQ